MVKWAYLVMGGVAGTVSRYLLGGFIAQRAGVIFPWGTVTVNLLGCFVIGFLDVLCEKKFLLSPDHRILLMTGFCGAFTTFSTLILETNNLLKDDQFLYAFGNVVISLGIGFTAFKLGGLIAEMI